MVDRRARLIALAAVVLAAGCAAPSDAGSAVESSVPSARLLFVGDAMLGRSVAPIIEAEDGAVFEDIRTTIRAADIAAVNVESPLTTRPHVSGNPYALEADPATAQSLAHAGFDVASVANNHAGDAGPESVIDSVEALEATGIAAVGGGADLAAALRPTVVEVNGMTVAYVAFDVSGDGLQATPTTPGIATWDEQTASATVDEARGLADVVVASIHGGIEYRDRNDPHLGPVAHALADWGVDVVWGHGPHVEQPIVVADPDGDGRPTVIATSLGNFLFDQRSEVATSAAPLLEVLVDADGVIAHRIGDEDHRDLRVHFTGWRVPSGDAANLAGSWWTIDRAVEPLRVPAELDADDLGDVVAASSGDLDGDGVAEILVSFRHPAVDKPWDRGFAPPADGRGRTAHIGVLDDGAPIWLSRRPPHPVGDLVACNGSAVFAFTTLDDARVIAVGGGVWSGFGFILEAELAGDGTIGCADIDGDGRTEPVVIDR